MRPEAQYGIVIFLVILLLIQLFLYRRSRRFIAASGLEKRTQRFLTAVLVLLFACANISLIVAVLMPLIRQRSSPHSLSELWRPVATYLLYPLAVWQAGSVGSFLLILLMDTLSGLCRWGWRRKPAESRAATVHLSRRRFVKQVGSGLAVLPFGVSTYGAVAASQDPIVELRRVALPSLPQPLCGLTIVQLTDIHLGPFMSQQRLEEYVNIVNRLEPDLVVITGDVVAMSNRYVAPAVAALSGLRARLGVFGSIGNHEHYTDSVFPLIEGFARNGMKVLLNEHVYLTVNGARLNLIGIDYVDRGAVRFDRNMRGIPLDGPTILLSHQPNVFPKAAGRGIDLTLSGHTHGGQVNINVLGVNITPAQFITPYIAGLYELGQSKLYVSRGLGTTGPPVRINAPAEITQIRLYRKGS